MGNAERPVTYEIVGSGAPTLFIPGLGERRFVWELIVHELSKNCSAITYDLRGYNGDEHGDFSIRDLADDAARLLRSLKVGPTTIVGHSEGGFIALELALAHPETVKAIVI